MARLLIIEDDSALSSTLALALEDAGHQVAIEGHGRSGLKRVESDSPELIISDVNLPGLDGFSLCRTLRERGVATPLILLTSRDGETDEAQGLELGADDYISKPFSTRVLLARIQALLRREATRRAPGDDDAQRVGQLSLSVDRLEVKWAATSVPVTVTEFRLIEALTRRPGLVLSRDTLLDHSRGDDAVVGDRLIDTYVRRLRRKFESVDSTFDRIETVIGAGYRWRES